MKIAYFDCRSGISGDMTLGALIDAGAEPEILARAAAALGIAGEVGIEVGRESRGHLTGVRVVLTPLSGPARTLADLRTIVGGSSLPERVRERALAALDRIGTAEASIHGGPPEALHLHELGGVDTLMDLCGSFWLLDSLGVEGVFASSLPAPRPPHTAPATARILAGSGATLEPDPRQVELVTPTGAAILATVATFSRPALRLAGAGWGIGRRRDPGNAVSLWIGEEAGEAAQVVILEANVDDMAPNLIAPLAEDLLSQGALDVSVAGLTMKKGRPGHLIRAVVRPEDEDRLAGFLLRRSTTLGVRATSARRHLAARRVIAVEIPEGTVRVKLKELDGQVVDVAPEYEDVRRLGGDPASLMRRAAEAARRALENS